MSTRKTAIAAVRLFLRNGGRFVITHPPFRADQLADPGEISALQKSIQGQGLVRMVFAAASLDALATGTSSHWPQPTALRVLNYPSPNLSAHDTLRLAEARLGVTAPLSDYLQDRRVTQALSEWSERALRVIYAYLALRRIYRGVVVIVCPDLLCSMLASDIIPGTEENRNWHMDTFSQPISVRGGFSAYTPNEAWAQVERLVY